MELPLVNTDLPKQRERDQVRQRYSVQFFAEDKQGEERRPDSKRTDLEWQEAEPLEVAMLRTMYRRRLLASSARTDMSHFQEPSSIEEVRAVAACMWIERRLGFPFNAIKKQWDADDVLKLTNPLGSRPARHEAIARETRLHRAGLHSINGSYLVDFNAFSLKRALDAPVGGIIEKVDLPLGVLLSLDGAAATDELSFFNWLSESLKRPKIDRALIQNIQNELSENGVALGSAVYTIDPEKLNVENIKNIRLVNEERGFNFTLTDLLRLHGITLNDEKDLRDMLEKYWRERVQTPSSEGGCNAYKENKKTKPVEFDHRQEATGRIGSLHALRKKAALQSMTNERMAEIEQAVRGGADVMGFANEIVEGFQDWFLRTVIVSARMAHGYREEDILDFLSEVNEVFVRRLPRFNGLLKNFAYSCLASAIFDASRNGLGGQGIDMNGALERITLSKHSLVQAAYQAALTTGAKEVKIQLPPTEKYPDGREKVASIEEVEESLLKYALRRGKMISLDAAINRGSEEKRGDRLHNFIGTARSPARSASAEMTEEMRQNLFNDLLEKSMKGIDTRLRPVLENLLQRRLGFPTRNLKDIAEELGVTESRISQLQKDDERLAKKLDVILLGLREQGKAKIAALLGLTDIVEEDD